MINPPNTNILFVLDVSGSNTPFISEMTQCVDFESILKSSLYSDTWVYAGDSHDITRKDIENIALMKCERKQDHREIIGPCEQLNIFLQNKGIVDGLEGIGYGGGNLLGQLFVILHQMPVLPNHIVICSHFYDTNPSSERISTLCCELGVELGVDCFKNIDLSLISFSDKDLVAKNWGTSSLPFFKSVTVFDSKERLAMQHAYSEAEVLSHSLTQNCPSSFQSSSPKLSI